MNEIQFSERIRQRYPEGLTGVFALGGTRTMYILEKNRSLKNPGKIDDYQAYIDYSHKHLLDFMEMFCRLGGQNMIIALFSYQGFTERGEDYARLMIAACLMLIDQPTQEFYLRHDIDPYFVGIDTLLHLPADSPAHELGARFAAFQETWQYQEGRRKVIWEVAPIPLYSFWQAHSAETAAELSTRLQQATELPDMHDMLFEYHSMAAYGTELPMPHFYLGTNRNGDMKLRAMLPISMLCGAPFRLYYTPYPSLFMTQDTLQAILEDLAFGEPMRASAYDYSGRLLQDQVEAEYQRVLKLRDDPGAVIGLTRSIQAQDREEGTV